MKDCVPRGFYTLPSGVSYVSLMKAYYSKRNYPGGSGQDLEPVGFKLWGLGLRVPTRIP